MRRLALAVLSALLLAACAPSGNWMKSGADAAGAGREYEDCRELAADRVRTEANIDQDIIASRHDDWQRAGIFRAEAQNIRDETRDRAAAIVASCMRAKGYGKPGDKPAVR